MTPLTLEEVLADVQQLPSLPAVIGELIATLDNENANIDQLADGIAKDQSLAARALRVANSSFFGIQHKVASIHDAIVILGFRAVGSLVTAASITSFFKPPAQSGFDLVRFWRHGIGTALCARALARGIPGNAGLDPEAGFTCGLLHDIGVLVLLTSQPTHYAAVLAYRDLHDVDLVEAEWKVLGFDHAQVGAAVATRWRFPAEVARAVALHHVPGDNPNSPLVDLTHVANILAHGLDLAGNPRAMVPPLDLRVWLRLGLDHTSLRELFSNIEREHEIFCDLLSG